VAAKRSRRLAAESTLGERERHGSPEHVIEAPEASSSRWSLAQTRTMPR
jgi:hypothetical protein